MFGHSHSLLRLKFFFSHDFVQHSNGPFVHWLHRRGRQNFCLQKSRMPLAGLVYFILDFVLWYKISMVSNFRNVPAS